MDEIQEQQPYYIEMYKSQDKVKLECNGMIVYETRGWFSYTLEFIQKEKEDEKENDADEDDDDDDDDDDETYFYEEVITNI